MTRSKPGDLHPYDLEVDKAFHRLSRNNKSVGLHDSVVVDSSIMHTDFITDSIFEPSFSASEFEISVDTMADNKQTLKELTTPDVVYQPWCIQYPKTEVSYELKS